MPRFSSVASVLQVSSSARASQQWFDGLGSGMTRFSSVAPQSSPPHAQHSSLRAAQGHSSGLGSCSTLFSSVDTLSTAIV